MRSRMARRGSVMRWPWALKWVRTFSAHDMGLLLVRRNIILHAHHYYYSTGRCLFLVGCAYAMIGRAFAIFICIRAYAKAIIACPSPGSGRTAAWYVSSLEVIFRPAGRKMTSREYKIRGLRK